MKHKSCCLRNNSKKDLLWRTIVIPKEVLSLELLLDFGLCDVFTLYCPESMFVDILLMTTLQDSKSLNPVLWMLLIIKSLLQKLIVFAGNMFFENEEATLKDLNARPLERIFTLKFQALEVSALQKFLAASNRVAETICQNVLDKVTPCNSCHV